MARKLEENVSREALIFDTAMLDLLNVDASTPLQTEVSDGFLIVMPVKGSIQHSEVMASLNRLRPRYKQMLENLAK